MINLLSDVMHANLFTMIRLECPLHELHIDSDREPEPSYIIIQKITKVNIKISLKNTRIKLILHAFFEVAVCSFLTSFFLAKNKISNDGLFV